ncbi:MAG TPA: Spy/CpxP family protein refolding chaperone [Xanthobacteraceae bacterium]|nr:Spy/CpxP family protein refolding chaperone [Xanthobacteraceae bacterium]
MRQWILAGAIALATAGPVFVDRDVVHAATLDNTKITDVNIAQIKSALKLTAAQLPLWERLEGVLRSIAREQAQDESASLLRRVSHRIVSVIFDDAAVQRLKEAAMPLLASLDEEQKAIARRIARQMGLGDMVATSN